MRTPPAPLRIILPATHAGSGGRVRGGRCMVRAAGPVGRPAVAPRPEGPLRMQDHPAAPVATAWMDLLVRGAGGRVVPSLSNCLVLLGHDARLRGMVAWDEFSCRHIITRAPPPPYAGAPDLPGPYPRGMEDVDVGLVQAYLQRAYDLPVGRAVADQACRTVAGMCRTHPVREWLDGLRWDGVPRLDTWLHSALGCTPDAYHGAVGTRFLCAAVRRVRQPGCKFDYVPVLEGRQGMGKSRLLSTLFGAAWFKDDLPRDLGEKDAAQGLLGVWGVEMAELQALGRSTLRDAKAFFSRQHDRYRPTYGAFEVSRPRQCVFAGTTNEAEYLTDPTGNRRYWPIACRHADVAWVATWRAQDDRMHDDPWRTPVTMWLRMRSAPHVRMADVLHLALGLPRDRQDRAAQNRVATLLRSLGWTRRRLRLGGDPQWVWVAP
ncbi:virulence-associated E family protein [Komagataeibacter oboediens]|uniref:virulence-associated E family protein n=1 Tax=Komagataeibacter oboediens TaxID=65958 RepID=UPI0023DB44E8|nr:virulence-associated E family protein [Komagataeibacter oboediens]WEQ51550.1 virulence-associated E family protein [Komagataeibacter oboediens]